MKAIQSLSVIVTLAAVLGGCSSSSKPAPAAPEKNAMAKESGGFYAEEAYKGRLYVFGTEKAHAQMKESGHAPQIAKTYIGAGPEGQTLVLEADSKTNDLQDRLKAQYESKHGTKLP